MTDSIMKLIVKVGETSKLSFSHSKAYRAISADDLINTYKAIPECNNIIIENVQEDEADAVKQFIVQFTSESPDKHVWFYVEDNDENTCGIADELDIDIFMTRDDFFRRFFDTTKMNISTSIEFRKEINKNEDDSNSAFDTAFDSTFGDIINSDSTKENKNAKEVEETEKETEVIEVEEVEQTKVETEQTKVETEQTKVEAEQPKVELNKVENNKAAKVADKFENKTDEVSIENKDSLLDEVPPIELDLSDIDLTDGDTSTNENILKLTSKLKETIEKNNELTDVIELANNRITELTSLNKALNEQYSIAIEEYNKIIESDDILEDPISLQEYKSIKDELDKTKDDIDKLNRTINSLTNQVKENNETIDSLTNQLNETKDSFSESSNELIILKEQIKNGEIQSKELEECKEQVELLENNIKSLENDLNNQKKEENRLRLVIDKCNETIDAESVSRQSTFEFVNLTIQRFTELNDKLRKLTAENEGHLEIIRNLQNSDSGNNEIIASQTEEIMELRGKISNVEKQIADAVADKQYENGELNKQLIALKAQFDMQSSQLKFKEEQYNRIVMISGVDESGANSLLESNKTLEEINRTLRQQIKLTQDEVEKCRKDKIQSERVAKQLEEQANQMKVSLRAMSSGITGMGNNHSTLPAINYQGRGFIIPVFGCGSFGITTTAMTLANRLSMAAKVAYVDLDLVAPKADGWFRQNPMCKNLPGFDPNNSKLSSMGIFFDKGMPFIISNINDIKFRIETTKNGMLDYYSGVYSKIDTVKLVSADFTGLVTYLGNNYQYVIIDLGRLGSSELNDQIIKIITDIAAVSVAVTTSDRIEVRNFRIKLTENKFQMDKIAWLLNMCDSSKIDDKLKQLISPARYGIMSFNPDYYGQKEIFTKQSRVAKDKIELFINSVMFGQ